MNAQCDENICVFVAILSLIFFAYRKYFLFFLNGSGHLLKGKTLTVFSAIMQSNYPVKLHFEKSTNKNFYATRTKSQTNKFSHL